MASNPVSGQIKSLPVHKMVATPILAAIEAHEAACAAYSDFFDRVCLDENGMARTVRFAYQQAERSEDGEATGITLQRVIDLPLFAVLPMPSFGVDKVDVDFEIEIQNVEESKSATDSKIDVSVKYGFGPWGVKAHGSVSHHKEQTRKTDTRAKYSFHVEASRQEPPEALQRIIEAVIRDVSSPIEKDKAPKLPAPTGAGAGTGG